MPIFDRIKEASTRLVPKFEPPLVMTSSIVKGATKRALFASSKERGIWYAETKTGCNLIPHTDPWQWDKKPRKLDFTKIYPWYNDSMTIAVRDGCSYFKEINLLLLGSDLFRPPYASAVTLREIQTCEMSLRNPHPNICQYRGVVVDKTGHVISLMFDRYDMDLGNLVKSGQCFDADACIRDVQNGVKHRHSLGLIHYDLKPANVFYSAHMDHFVLGDFDASQQIGTRIQLKRGAEAFRPLITKSTDIACPAMDWYGVEVLKFWLRKKGNGKAERGAMLPKTRVILAEAAELVIGKQFCHNKSAH
jgi:serine/threonine protein kinase